MRYTARIWKTTARKAPRVDSPLRVRVIAAHGLVWLFCLGFSYSDAVSIHYSAVAAIRDAITNQPPSTRALMRAVRTSLAPAVRNKRRWDSHEFLHRLVDAYVNAFFAALLPALTVGVIAFVIFRSIVASVILALAAGFAALVARAVQRLRRVARLESDEAYRIKLSHPTARALSVPNVVSTLRIPGAILVGFAASGHDWTAAAIILGSLVLSDVADGQIARRLRQETYLGRQLV